MHSHDSTCMRRETWQAGSVVTPLCQPLTLSERMSLIMYEVLSEGSVITKSPAPLGEVAVSS
jgi:hypothetical protein